MGNCHSGHLGIALILCAFLLGAVHCNNPPRITVGPIQFAQENTALGTELFNITVNDMDTSDTLNVFTSGSETEALMRLEPLLQSNGERRFRVLLKSRLDRDRDPPSRMLQFRATDGHIKVPGSVKLFIQDVNDNPPYFQNLPYRLELPERTDQAGSVVYLFTASDPDQGPGGTVHYFMTDADNIYDTTFVIQDPRTGQVWLERELDYENRTFYQYEVFAKDTGSPPCPGELCHCNNFTEPHVSCTGLNTTFTVTIKDVQDTPPFFVGLPYITQLYENATINTTVLSVSALDGDRGVPNRVNYSIENEEGYPFSMDAHTGVIRVRQPGLDADTPDGRSYLITVMATEMEAAGQAQYGKTSASTQVSITVQDVNNNSPQFANHVYYATVQENTPEGVPVTINQTITVLDKDQVRGLDRTINQTITVLDKDQVRGLDRTSNQTITVLDKDQVRGLDRTSNQTITVLDKDQVRGLDRTSNQTITVLDKDQVRGLDRTINQTITVLDKDQVRGLDRTSNQTITVLDKDQVRGLDRTINQTITVLDKDQVRGLDRTINQTITVLDKDQVRGLDRTINQTITVLDKDQVRGLDRTINQTITVLDKDQVRGLDRTINQTITVLDKDQVRGLDRTSNQTITVLDKDQVRGLDRTINQTITVLDKDQVRGLDRTSNQTITVIDKDQVRGLDRTSNQTITVLDKDQVRGLDRTSNQTITVLDKDQVRGLDRTINQTITVLDKDQVRGLDRTINQTITVLDKDQVRGLDRTINQTITVLDKDQVRGLDRTINQTITVLDKDQVRGLDRTINQTITVLDKDQVRGLDRTINQTITVLDKDQVRGLDRTINQTITVLDKDQVRGLDRTINQTITVLDKDQVRGLDRTSNQTITVLDKDQVRGLDRTINQTITVLDKDQVRGLDRTINQTITVLDKDQVRGLDRTSNQTITVLDKDQVRGLDRTSNQTITVLDKDQVRGLDRTINQTITVLDKDQVRGLDRTINQTITVLDKDQVRGLDRTSNQTITVLDKDQVRGLDRTINQTITVLDKDQVRGLDRTINQTITVLDKDQVRGLDRTINQTITVLDKDQVRGLDRTINQTITVLDKDQVRGLDRTINQTITVLDKDQVRGLDRTINQTITVLDKDQVRGLDRTINQTITVLDKDQVRGLDRTINQTITVLDKDQVRGLDRTSNQTITVLDKDQVRGLDRTINQTITVLDKDQVRGLDRTSNQTITVLDKDQVRGLDRTINQTITVLDKYQVRGLDRTINQTITVLDKDQVRGLDRTINQTITVLDKDQVRGLDRTINQTITVLDKDQVRGLDRTINQTITVLDKDQNANSQFRLSVENEGTPYFAFSTLPSSDTTVHGSTTVMITVNDSALLDFEQRQTVSFQIYAKETETREQFFNFTTVIVAILDMNDNSPYFAENQTTRVNVTENASSGKLLATLTATDRDSGAFGTVDYILEDNFGGRFSIGKTSGEVRVNGSLDREGGEESFTLVVVARDNVGAVDSQRRSTRHRLMVTLQDLNDNDPAFLHHPPRVAVRENSDVHTLLLTVKATDMDQGDNGKVIYHVVSIHSMATTSPTAPQPPLFSIDEITGEVSVNVSLTDRPGLYNVTFEASDKGATPRWVRTSVVVDVKDVNNHPPVFVNPDEGFVNATAGQVPNFNVTIYEEEERGTFIIQLRATDADLADNGKVYFYLDPDLGGDFVNFQVDPLSGNLSNRFCLDAEKKTESYQINLRAQDQGAQLSLSSVIPFTIHLRDIDDNPPEFFQKEPLVLAVKEQAADVSVGFVNVSTDQDQDPQNQVACYYLYGGEMVSSFQLHQTTGELRLLNKLDRDQTLQITLEVKVTRNCTLQDNYFTDSTHNSSSTNTSSGGCKRNRSIKSVLQVKVDVLDVNNHPPVFDKGALKVGLLYDVAVETEVTNLVTYTSDKDTAEYSKHMYRLLKFQDSNLGPEPSLNSTFAVSANGSVVTRRLFRADEGGNFILTVQVYDIDGLKDTASLTIYLVSNLQRVRLVFNKGPNEVNRIKGDMVRKLGEVLNMTIVADKIATHINLDGTPDPQRTDVFVHARYFPSGEIVPTSELVSAFDYNARVFSIFQEYGVANVSPLEKAKEESEEEKEQKVFIIAIIVLAIVSIALVLVLVTSVRRYRRRLRAVTTSAYVTSKTMPDNEIPPGTNYYYTSENPLFGKDVKPEDFDRPEARVKDHHDDTDSLDDNAVDGGARSERRREAEPEEEEEEEEQEVMMDMYDDDVRPSAPRNPLASVLREYDSQIAASKPTSSNTKSASPNTKSTSNNNTIHSAVLSPTSPMAASMLGGRSEVWRPSPLVGHVKAVSRSGKCNDAFDYDLDDLQHSDI
ncbi:hypothetical protein ACOMHN_057182 [Nucella lapillus]